MKMMMRRFCSALMAAAMSLSLFSISAAAADGEVGITFTEDERVVFDQDDVAGLLPAFQDLYPGDEVSQEIYLRNRYSQDLGVSIYVSVNSGNEDGMEDSKKEAVHKMLTDASLIEMTVYNGSNKLYTGPLSNNGQAISLGALNEGHGAPLRVDLKVSPEMGNEYQDLAGYLDWTMEGIWNYPYIPSNPDGSSETSDEEIDESSVPLTSFPETESSGVEEAIPAPDGPDGQGGEGIDDDDTPLSPFPDQEKLPQTGDAFPVEIVAVAGACCAAVAVVVLITGKKRKNVK